MKRLAVTVVVACLALSVRLFAAAPTLGQHAAGTAAASALQLSPTGLTDGSTLIIGVSQTATGTRTYTVADTNTNTYTSAGSVATSAGSNNPHFCQIFYAKNITTTAGATTVTITQSSSLIGYKGQYVEVLGASTTAPLDQFSSAVDAADSTSHNFATSMTTANDVFVYSVNALNSTSTFTATSSPAFTTLTGDFSVTSSQAQYYSNATGLSANNLAYSGGTARTAASCTASFVAAVTAGIPPGSFGLFGIGR